MIVPEVKEQVIAVGLLVWGGRYCVALRGGTPARPGQWEFPGGNSLWGESVEETLVREFEEKFHLQVTVLDRLCTIACTDRGVNCTLHACYVSCGSLEEIRPSEHVEYRFVTLEELALLEMGESDSEVRRVLLDGAFA